MSDLYFKGLTIDNFKAFSGRHEISLARAPGLYYITGLNRVDPELGANGVGKTTIWDALLWVLFGRTGRDNRPADAIKPWFGTGQTSVELHFMRGENPIDIKRTRNPNRLSFRDMGEVEGREIQQEEVASILGMSEEMCRRTIIIGQFGKLFLDLKPEEQSQMFSEALDLDVWLRAMDKASDAGSAARKAINLVSNQESAAAASLHTLEAEIINAEQESKAFEADKAGKIRKAQKAVAQMDADLAALDKKSVKEPEEPSSEDAEDLRQKSTDAAVALEVELGTQRANDAERGKASIGLAKIKKNKKLCPSCEQPIGEKAWQAAVDAAEAEVFRLSTVADEITARLKKLKRKAVEAKEVEDEQIRVNKAARRKYEDDLKEYVEWFEERKAARGVRSRYSADLKEAEAAENVAETRLTRLKKRRRDLRLEKQEAHDTLAQAERTEKEAAFWVEGFREIRLAIIDETLLELEMATSRHAAMLGLNDWGIKFDTERETKKGAVSYGFSVMLYPPGKDDPVKWESYSGGESQRWQLAVAFALSEVLLSRAGLTPNLEILDEPTRGLSPQGIEDLLEHLRMRAHELKRAIYFVDHHSLDKGIFDGTLLVEKTKKGSSFKWQ